MVLGDPELKQLIALVGRRKFLVKIQNLVEQCGLLFLHLGTKPGCPCKQREGRITEPTQHIKTDHVGL